ncbi:quinone-dependent dihydroorotate dehydrogenase [Wolinella succinogenes]|uniref:Dihydroorotate dehydrogenase (quinone) n=1 Tax=Wolinella succinogenes (strain ATCC 29543 / DSM 1740 / CCUG 13145 / JCM 31913 / LMG 7466 / NCTC 11488 / FDC 602W) TaxID=273121 RepID=Q7M7L8_WOLSU|nr:quinone-dependent dihydroorotate dehydrogenase [Wolinella succinogenes]NLU33550.1 quinone-dependent dihydroorotate dehydrogenase [Wolinella succinogenes]CAE11207.1 DIHYDROOROTATE DEHYDROGENASE [Wolinella succinogenes]VEG81373.1 Dihydroorotate dehydrogenase (quinone) [Wolinella succinogenes]HCZ17995.1 quinone-dependent dihydroorotate dehydrogenase [Helicobacter sp.]
MFSYENLREYFFKLDPEHAHAIIETLFKLGGAWPMSLEPIAKRACVIDPALSQEIEGLTFYNPVGLGAGFDKNATMIRALTALGFGHLELGTITPKPQSGNPKPRLFRHVKEESIQNAMGFNNDGALEVAKRLKKLYPYAIPLGMNIGKNKLTPQEEALKDYEIGLKEFSDIADYIAINISSPNTPNLRDLQNEAFIHDLFTLATEITSKPLFLKIAPDMKPQEAIKLCSRAIESGAKGIIATNTTIDYSVVEHPKEVGGISGKALQEKSYALFKELGKAFYGKTTLISVGGIDSGREAYRRIKAGASLVQIYSAMIFKGPFICQKINEELLECLKEEGYSHLTQAIGSDLNA